MEDYKVPESLLNLAAMTTAKHVACEEMEQHCQLWDETIMKTVAFWACPQDTNADMRRGARARIMLVKIKLEIYETSRIYGNCSGRVH